METILLGIFVLFCAGFIVGQSYLFTRQQDTPKKEPERQVMMQRDHHSVKATSTFPEGTQDYQEDSPQDQKPINPQE